MQSRNRMIMRLCCLLIALIMGVWIGAAAIAAPEESDRDQHLQALLLLFIVRNADDKCAYLNKDERAHLDAYILVGLQGVSLTAAQREMLEQGEGKPGDLDCSKQKGFVDLFRSSIADKKEAKKDGGDAKKGDDDDDDDDEPSDEDVAALTAQLKKVMGSLPKGRLTALQGCWTGQIADWTAELCLTQSGDVASFNLAAPSSGVTCLLPEGEARRREGSVSFYAFSASPGKCSDDRAIQHVEGMCQPEGNAKLSCMISVYRRGNVFFLVSKDADADPLNGRLGLSRR